MAALVTAKGWRPTTWVPWVAQNGQNFFKVGLFCSRTCSSFFFFFFFLIAFFSPSPFPLFTLVLFFFFTLFPPLHLTLVYPPVLSFDTPVFFSLFFVACALFPPTLPLTTLTLAPLSLFLSSLLIQPATRHHD